MVLLPIGTESSIHRRIPAIFTRPTFLAQFFDTIEINTSFYQPLQPHSPRTGSAASRTIPAFCSPRNSGRNSRTNPDATAEDEKLVRAGFDPLLDAGKLGAVLLQFPFSFHHTSETLARLKICFETFRDYPLVVEVRHSSWAQPEFYDLLHERGVGFCNIDQPVIGKSMKPTERTTSPVGYFRLHGRRYDTWFTDDPEVPSLERYNYLYSEEELEPWAKRIEHVAKHAENTFVITQQSLHGKAAVNALQLIHLLAKRKVKVPEPLRQHYPQLESIASEPRKSRYFSPPPPIQVRRNASGHTSADIKSHPESNRFECFRNLLLEEIFEGFTRIIRTSRRRRSRWSSGISNRRSILFHRHAKLEKRAIVLRHLVRDSFRNRLRAFKLRRRIEMHALLAGMHRRLAARAFAILIESRS